MDTPLERFLSRLKGVKKYGNHYIVCCPAHDDRHASLSATEGRDGRLLAFCHAGCSFRAIVLAAGLRMSDVFPEKGRRGGRR